MLQESKIVNESGTYTLEFIGKTLSKVKHTMTTLQRFSLVVLKIIQLQHIQHKRVRDNLMNQAER